MIWKMSKAQVVNYTYVIPWSKPLKKKIIVLLKIGLRKKLSSFFFEVFEIYFEFIFACHT